VIIELSSTPEWFQQLYLYGQVFGGIVAVVVLLVVLVKWR